MDLSPLFSWHNNITVRVIQTLAILTIGLIIISLINFYQAVRPSRIPINGTPSDFGLSAENITLTATDGIKLRGWYIPNTEKENPPSLILLHGYPAEKADMLRISETQHPHFSVLLLDLRYFGESEGRATTLGIKEPDDIKHAITLLKEKGHEKIGIFGFSFGGAVALMTAAENSNVTAVGSYASYADLRQLGYDLFSILPGVKYPLVEFMNLWSGLFFGDFVLSYSPQKAAQKLDIPTLIIHSKEGEQISFKNAEKLQKSLQHNKQAQYIFMEKGRHGVLPDDFYDQLIIFFGRG